MDLSSPRDVPAMEVEFEVVSTYCPRVIRFRAGEDDPSPTVHDVRDRAARWPGDDSVFDILAWAYYQACQDRCAASGGPLPWDDRRGGRRWRQFRDRMARHLARRWDDSGTRWKRALELFHDVLRS